MHKNSVNKGFFYNGIFEHSSSSTNNFGGGKYFITSMLKVSTHTEPVLSISKPSFHILLNESPGKL